MKIRKSVILLIAFTIIPILVNAQTQYYKLQSYGKTGIENRKVSGGQFITFQAAICMETDIDGVSIGSGILKRNLNTISIKGQPIGEMEQRFFFLQTRQR